MRNISLEKVIDILRSEGESGRAIGVKIHGSLIRLDLENGDTVELGREHIGGIDWFIVKLNDQIVHQG